MSRIRTEQEDGVAWLVEMGMGTRIRGEGGDGVSVVKAGEA